MGTGAPIQILIIPPLFDEHNKLRRQLIAVMRLLEEAGIGSFLPDLPGCNESLEPIVSQTLSGWRAAVQSATTQTSATHVLAVRSGALLAPDTLPTWHYAPQTGAKLLRNMVRARVIAAKEAGLNETSEGLLAAGLKQGLNLAGWELSARMMQELQGALPMLATVEITQEQLGGAPLWLRSEPEFDAEQAQALADFIIDDLGKST